MTTPRKHPETLRLRQIFPSLTVNDLSASLSWYRDQVGFYVKQSWENEGTVVAAELVAGDQSILLMQDDGALGMDRKKGEGFRLHLETTQEIDDVAAAIRARGGSLATEPEDKPWGVRSFDLIDPDGFKLTIRSPHG